MPETAGSPPKPLANFLKALSCNTAISALVSQSEELHTALNSPASILCSQDAVTIKLLLREAPLIARLVQSLQVLPESCRFVFFSIFKQFDVFKVKA